MDSEFFWKLLALVLGSNALVAFIQYMITRHDNKKGIEKTINEVKHDLGEHKATLARTHILRFNDELRNGVKHSEEYFRQQILDIDTYDRYCAEHPDFANGLTVMASEHIKNEYKRLFLDNVERKD
jgi:hypothetical protein